MLTEHIFTIYEHNNNNITFARGSSIFAGSCYQKVQSNHNL